MLLVTAFDEIDDDALEDRETFHDVALNEVGYDDMDDTNTSTSDQEVQ